MNSVLELVAEIGDVFAEELSRLLVSVGRSIRKVSPMLGVKRDNRESVHGPKGSRFDAEHWVGRYPNPLRRVR